LTEYIDWSPFFWSWQLKGKFPDILTNEKYGAEAQKLYNDARSLLRRIIDEKWLTAKGVIGFFPANAVNDDDIEVYTDDSRQTVRTTLRHLRQQNLKANDKPNYCLADFVAPKDSGVPDYIGSFAVTTGIGIEARVRAFEQNHDDYHAIMLKSLADRLAEAFAECMHAQVRRQWWGYAPDEALENDDLIAEKYQGIRPAPGYPACPDHTEKATLWQLMDVENQTGMKLTESFAMHPAASVSGWYFAHPESTYFAVKGIGKDQVTDYAKRKGMEVDVMEKWLAHVLNYD
ncbi:MAG: methionine synthase, partial [Bacteroidetes bacterium]